MITPSIIHIFSSYYTLAIVHLVIFFSLKELNLPQDYCSCLQKSLLIEYYLLLLKYDPVSKVIGQNVQQNAAAHITEVLPLHMCCLCLYFYLKYCL